MKQITKLPYVTKYKIDTCLCNVKLITNVMHVFVNENVKLLTIYKDTHIRLSERKMGGNCRYVTPIMRHCIALKRRTTETKSVESCSTRNSPLLLLPKMCILCYEKLFEITS